MNLNRRNVMLLSVFAVLVATDIALRSPRPTDLDGSAVFAGFDSTQAAEVRIETSAETITLTRAANRWAVDERQNFAAYQPALTDLFQRLVLLSTRDLVASESSSHELFGLGHESAHLVISDADGAVLIDTLVGRPRDEAVGSYVSPAGDDAVYRAASLPALTANAGAWLNTRLLELDLPDVRGMAGELADGSSFRLVRRDDGLWDDGHGKTVPPALMSPLLVVANTLYFEDIVPIEFADAGLDEPWAKVRFELDAGGERVVWLGAPHESGGRTATRPEWPKPWVAVLPARSAARLEAALAKVAGALR